MIQCNIQSLEKHKAELHRALVEGSYEIVLLSETWTKQNLEQSNRYKLPRYHFIATSRDDNYGGTAIMLLNDFNYQAIQLPATSDWTQACGINVFSLDIVVVSIYISADIPANVRRRHK